MHATWTVIAQLLPALAGVPADTGLRPAPSAGAPAMPAMAPVIDWERLRGGETPARDDTVRARGRARAVEYSGFYQARLKLHRTLSYTMIPLFVGSYITGDQILKHRNDPPKWASTLHKPFAIATGTVFTVNTVTGLWNLWDSRKNPQGQTKRTVHSLLFMAATAGFTYAGTSLAHDAKVRNDRDHFHKTVAVASMGVSVLSWGLMVFFK